MQIQSTVLLLKVELTRAVRQTELGRRIPQKVIESGEAAGGTKCIASIRIHQKHTRRPLAVVLSAKLEIEFVMDQSRVVLELSVIDKPILGSRIGWSYINLRKGEIAGRSGSGGRTAKDYARRALIDRVRRAP